MDNVNSPSHYNQGKIECIDAMIEAFGKDTVAIWCKLNAFKYLWREEYKNGIEDVKKAQYYINKMIELRDKEVPFENQKEEELEKTCYPDCVHWKDIDDDWCREHCRCGVPPYSEKYKKLPYAYKKST